MTENRSVRITQSRVYLDKCDFCGAKEVKCLHMKLRANFLNGKMTIQMPDTALTPKIIRTEKSICEWCLQDITAEMLKDIHKRI